MIFYCLKSIHTLLSVTMFSPCPSPNFFSHTPAQAITIISSDDGYMLLEVDSCEM